MEKRGSKREEAKERMEKRGWKREEAKAKAKATQPSCDERNPKGTKGGKKEEGKGKREEERGKNQIANKLID